MINGAVVNRPPLVVRTLRQWRRRKGISQLELARQAGHSVSTISGIERGKNARPEVMTMRDVSRVLGVGISQIREFGDGLEDKPTGEQAPGGI